MSPQSLMPSGGRLLEIASWSSAGIKGVSVMPTVEWETCTQYKGQKGLISVSVSVSDSVSLPSFLLPFLSLIAFAVFQYHELLPLSSATLPWNQ